MLNKTWGGHLGVLHILDLQSERRQEGWVGEGLSMDKYPHFSLIAHFSLEKPHKDEALSKDVQR